MVLNEMALNRQDAINRCLDLGPQFINHFHKIFNNDSDYDSFTHHCIEMQGWWDSVRKIKLKSNNKYLTNVNLIDWFFTAGGDIDKDNGFMTEEEIDKYNDFIIYLLSNREADIKEFF